MMLLTSACTLTTGKRYFLSCCVRAVQFSITDANINAAAVHCIYRPWLAFRAVVLVDIPGPEGPVPPTMQCPATAADLAAAEHQMQQALGNITTGYISYLYFIVYV
jgi:hypothetical protein